MATRKQVITIPEEMQPTQIAEVEIVKEDFMMIGQDAELTDMIYGKPLKQQEFKSDILPDITGETQGLSNNLQLFVNLYQPGELINARRFRDHLLQCLNDWKENDGTI